RDFGLDWAAVRITTSGTALIPPPAPPGALAALSGSSTQVTLTWIDNAGDELGFRVERSPDGSAWTGIASTAASPDSGKTVAYADTGLAPNATYYYRVLAYNDGGDSASSNLASAATLAPPPLTPESLTASANSDNQVILTWTYSSGNTIGFKIERSLYGNSWIEVAAIDAHPDPENLYSYTDGYLEANTSYHYRILAYNNNGRSGYSKPASVTTLAATPSAPVNLTASLGSGDKITLSWIDSASNEAGFIVERSPDNSSWIEIGRTQASPDKTNLMTHSDSSATAGVTYYYRVQAYNNGGVSEYSNIVSTTIPASPSNMTEDPATGTPQP
ncbi:MAG: fibronectin type III domain-containing protein, partial [Anaerolineales bacterium]|nr:fibronectin type III domain-containing protein [Anaerolineales bacterium]